MKPNLHIKENLKYSGCLIMNDVIYIYIYQKSFNIFIGGQFSFHVYGIIDTLLKHAVCIPVLWRLKRFYYK